MTQSQNDNSITRGSEAGETRRPAPLMGRMIGGSVTVLRAVAGMPAGVTRTRRGTFLVVVIGTLALLAVIAIAHFAIGQADRRVAASVTRAARIDEVPQQFADYVSGIVTRDVFDTVPEEINDLMAPSLDPDSDFQTRFIGRREAFDRPFTDWRTTSDTQFPTVNNAGLVPNRAYFTPEGSGSDPWLADLAPRWLNYTSQAAPNAQTEYLLSRDWGKISNVSPDGRFANLRNLRNNFAAEPGFGVGPRNLPRMSEGLTLLNWDINNPLQAPTLTNQTDFNIPVGQGTLISRRPAVWDSRQRGAFRPMKQWQNIQPSQPGYLGNEWADTDGDGFADARWIELVDARNVATIRSYLQTDGRMRWFFATRIVDLSGLVNVNTATDLVYEPGAAFPMGLTPADIDLKRLLVMQDPYVNWGVGYNRLMQSVPRATPAPGSINANNYLGYDQAMAFRMGSGAYEAIRWSILGSLVPTRFTDTPWDWRETGINAADRGVLRHLAWRTGGGSAIGASDNGSNEINLPAQFPPSDLGDLLTRRGVNNPQETSRLEAATGARLGPGGAGPAAVRPTAYDPLRQNREIAYELDRTGEVVPGAPVQVRDTGDVTPEAMVHNAVDLRSQLTTMSLTRRIKNVVGNEQTLGGLPSGSELLESRDGQLSLGDAAITGQLINEGEVFRAYVRALAPAIKFPGVWPAAAGGGDDFNSRKTLFYGHQGPELALLTAGAMTVNLRDMLKRDTELPTPTPLVFDGKYAADLFLRPLSAPLNAENVTAAPFLIQKPGLCLEPTEDNGAKSVLAVTNTNPIMTPVLNLYGIQPQVIMTEVGCYTVWHDATPSHGGDADTMPQRAPGGLPAGGVTIDGRMAANNADYMFRCVAFQLHNPFDVRVTVTEGFPGANPTPDQIQKFHYVRIRHGNDQAGTPTANVLLAPFEFDASFSTITINSLTLDPGQTVTLYTFGEPIEQLADRLLAQGVVTGVRADAFRFITEWGQRQFDVTTAGGKPARYVPLCNDAMDAFIRPDSAVTRELIDDPDANRGMVVQLFKAVRADMTAYQSGAQYNELAANARNLTGNDQMVDRFRIKSGKTLDSRLEPRNIRVDGTLAGSHGAPFDPVINHNGGAGLTVMRWTVASRPSDPSGSTIPVGGLPAYLIEPKNPNDEWHTIAHEDSGMEPETKMTVTRDIIDQLENDKGEGQFQMDNWVNRVRAFAFSETINKETKDRSVPAIIQNRDSKDFLALRDLMPVGVSGDRGFGAANAPLAAKLPVTGGNADVSLLRASDLLLPMTICPWESPLRPDLQPQTNPDIRYLTLPEAMAVAYGYENIPVRSAAPGNADPLSLYSKAPALNNADGGFGDSDRPVIQAGHIVIDDFVPFYDGAPVGGNGKFDRDQAYNGISTGGALGQPRDIRFGLGIPAALGIMDQVTGVERVFGTVFKPVAGLVNINTAPLNVLRTLPMLTPADESWQSGNTDPIIWGNAWPQNDKNIDLAASVAAYRDKTLTSAMQGRQTAAKFEEDPAANRPFINASNNPAQTQSTERQRGRAEVTQLDGIREELGFLSIGELGCVLNRDADSRGPGGTRNSQANIDGLGFNNASRGGSPSNDRLGFNSVLYRNGGNMGVDDVRNDFAERLQVLSSLSNVTTVRSDVFACWFIVRGYTQEDVENLGPDDPMAPSVERRFLMIIDRSTVSTLSQAKPRIVLFKEVPL